MVSGKRDRTTEGVVDRRVAMSAIFLGPSPRHCELDLAHVEVLAEIEGKLPPILVRRSTMQIIDGRHRYRAAEIRGDSEIDVEFFDGDEEQAFAAAVQCNVTHGMPLTLAERKAAAARIIRAFPDRSDRWVASTAGLAASTVAAVRRCSTVQPEQLNGRIGADGKVRPLDPEDRRRRTRRLVMASPNASLRAIAREAGVSPATVRDVRRRMAEESESVELTDTPRSRGRPASVNTLERGAAEPAPAVSGSAYLDPVGSAASSATLEVLLQKLRRDPSLRFSESGRELLRWITRHTLEFDQVKTLVEQTPPHCALLLAEFARACQDRWRELAETLGNPEEPAASPAAAAPKRAQG